MRNAVLESISHKLFIWLFVVYQSPMRIWEMKFKKNHIKIIIKAINFKSIHKTIFLKLILFLHRFKLNDNLVYYGTFLNVSIKNSAVSREDF